MLWLRPSNKHLFNKIFVTLHCSTTSVEVLFINLAPWLVWFFCLNWFAFSIFKKKIQKVWVCFLLIHLIDLQDAIHERLQKDSYRITNNAIRQWMAWIKLFMAPQQKVCQTFINSMNRHFYKHLIAYSYFVI